MKLYRKLIQKTLREGSSTFTGDRSKLSWRKNILREFGEWVPVANAGGPTMGTSTTFGYYVGGSPVINGETGQPITYTASGLGGVEALPTTVTIDQGFGDIANVDAPTYNQLSLAGYAPMLPFFRRDDYKDVNAMLDASQEYARRVLADVYMGARVELNREIDRQEEQRIEIMNKVSSYVSQLGIDFEKLQKGAQIDKYGRLVVLNYDGGVLGGLKNSNNRSITIYNPAKDAQGNLLKIQDTGNKTLQKGETVFGTQYSPMPDEATVQTWSNVGDVAHFTDFGSGHNPNEIGEVLVGNKIVGPKIVGPKIVGPEIVGPGITQDDKINMIMTSAKLFKDYLGTGWSERKVIDRKYLGSKYMDFFFKDVTFDGDGTYVNDGVIGSGRPPRYNSKTGKIEVRATFDFDKNAAELQKPGADARLLDTIPGFEYWRDAQIDPIGRVAGGFAGVALSPVISAAKGMGKAKATPIVISFTPNELKNKNPKEYKRLINMGVIKESTTWDRIQKYR